ncbi:hypothetical protein [Methylobacterium sp. WL6]|uniref:hypothetical protein n=1 Tax=Methylobacterium sp. WL6 TaxID=2603901 RepID=UPI0011C84B8E|nr:hypothetical protein [Methylobacterium sp. WL6]TXN71740.1 hypothetical protein FV230_07405 [Methylobacterium sp. WL6]
MTSTNTIPADGLSFVPIRGRALSHGYHVARRRNWAADAAWHLVYLYVLEDEAGTTRGVFQAGSTEPDDPDEWIFRSRVVGLEHLPATLPPHPRVPLALVVH